MRINLHPKSRSNILAACLIVILGVFVVRLFYLQALQHDYYVQQADREQVKKLTIPAVRGEIYVMDEGVPAKVVMNETVYNLFVDPKVIKNPKRIEELVKKVAGGNVKKNFEQLLKKTETRYQVLATELSYKQAKEIKKANIYGLGLQSSTRRVYPEGGLAGQTLGFVNSEGVGQYGIEGYLNERLKGKNGRLEAVTDISQVPLTIGTRNVRTPAQHGDNLVLTIDRNIQSYTESALKNGLEKIKATEGSILVMDPASGKVLAMANYPSYNPGEYSKVKSANLFMNPIVTDIYEAGSVVKTLTVATALDKHAVEPTTTFYNTDKIKVYDRVIGNVMKGNNGDITVQTALSKSLNTGMVYILRQLGNGTINYQARSVLYDYFHNKYRLGKVTGIEQSAEAPGIIISPDKEQGNAVRYANMSFGQGMSITMMQMSAAFSSIINGGTYYQPTLVAGNITQDGGFKRTQPKIVEANVISKESSNKIRQMTKEARGGFFGSQDKPGFEVGGKTGTSETVKDGQYSKSQTVGTYIGFGGDSSPKYVIMVRVAGQDMNLQGSLHAAPIFADVSNWMLDYLKLKPKG